MTPLRIAVLAHLHHPVKAPFAGGMEAHTAHLVADLSARGHEVTLYAKAGSAVFGDKSPGRVVGVLPENYQVQGYPDEDQRDEQHQRLDRAMESAVRLVQGGDFDAVINNSLSPIPHAQLCGIPVLHILHTPPLPRITALLETGQGLSERHRYVTVSQCNARAWGRWLPELHVVSNGIDLQRWRPEPVLRINPGTAAWTGRITPEKGTHLAIEAARANGLHLKLAGPIQDPAYFAELIAPQLGTDVEYLGHLDQQQLRSMISSAQVFISSPLWEEPFGLTTLEAMACGTPVAATPAGAMAELLGDTGGVLARRPDATALSEAVRRVLGANRQVVQARAAVFSVERMIEAYEQALYEISSSSRAESLRR